MAAVRALYMEVALEPKPGLVSFRDTGSHRDMHAGTFVRSLFSLRHYFCAIAQAGADRAGFERLESLGKRAEAGMLAATGGINTHRGAIFCLGLLCAGAGRCATLAPSIDAAGLRSVLRGTWGPALRERADHSRASQPHSHGQHAARRHGLRSASEEAAAAFPVLFDVTWPTLQQALAQGMAQRSACVQALFATMAVLDDTNLVHRGGIAGLRYAQRAAHDFLAAGGVRRDDWVEHARSVHASFVARNLSPGGAADLLGAACWLRLLAVEQTSVAARPVEVAA